MNMKKYKYIIAFVLAFMVLPMMAQDYMSIFFKNGDFRKFYMKNITGITTSKVDAEGIEHEDYSYQHITTIYDKYIYSLEDVDSITFTKVDEEKAEHNFVTAMPEVFSALEDCETIADVENKIDDIKNTEGVADAWSDGHELHVSIAEGETFSFHFNHDISGQEDNIGNDLVAQVRAMKSQFVNLLKDDGTPLKILITDQQSKDESLHHDALFNKLIQEFAKCGINIDYRKDPTVDFFYNNSEDTENPNFYDYDIVLLSTHGSYGPIAYNRPEEEKNGEIIAKRADGLKGHTFNTSEQIGEPIDAKKDFHWEDRYKAFKEWRDNKQYGDVTDVHISFSFANEVRGGKEVYVAYPKLTEYFFRDIAKGKFKNPNSIFHNAACQSLKGDSPDQPSESFANILFNNRGLGAYFGYTETNLSGQRGGRDLLFNLALGNSIKKSYDKLQDWCKLESLENFEKNANVFVDSKDHEMDTPEKVIKYYRENPPYKAELKLLYSNHTTVSDSFFLFPVITVSKDNKQANEEYVGKGQVTISGLTTFSSIEDGISTGFYYSTHELRLNEHIKAEKEVISGSGLGNCLFKAQLTNLEPGKTYYYCAYTSDGVNRNFGEKKSFTITPLRVSTSLLSLKVGWTQTVNISSGYGNYKVESSDEDVATVSVYDYTISINALKEGDATITVTDKSGQTATIKVTVIEESINTPAEAIDLGLPSGTLWASWNLGATKPEESGDYYAWGETKRKEIYNLDTYQNWKDANGDGKLQPGELSSPLIIAGTIYDAATVNWGAEWYTPTYKQVEELLNNTTSEWVNENGVKGRRFTSNTNGNSIFLPVTGLNYPDVGCYWSSTAKNADYCGANYLVFGESYVYCSGNSPYPGFIIRPVKGSSLPDYTNSKERDNLIELYNSTNGDSWTQNDNWCSSQSPAHWYGITYDKYNEHVEYIKLANNNLTGSISIKGFEILYNIDIKGNNISSLTIDSCPKLNLGYGFRLDDITLDFLQINNCLYDMGQHFIRNANIKKILFTNFQKCDRIFLQGVVSDEVVIKDCVFDDEGVEAEDNSAVKTMIVENSTIKDGRLGGDVDELIIKNSTIGDWWVISAKSSITIINSYIEGHLIDCSGTPDEVSKYVYSVIAH
jgi:hypothetical protein